MLGGDRVDPDRDDPVLAHRLDPELVAVGEDLVAALRQPAELAEDVAADRVVGVGVDRQLDPGVLEVAERDVPADVPIAVGEPAQRRRAGSVSSSISPTTSSRMSSTVTIPTVRPYSSETIPIELRWRCSSASRSSSGLVSGTTGTSRTAGSIGASAPAFMIEPGEAVVVDDAADPVGVVVLDHDEPRVAGADAAPQRLLDGLVGVRR